MPCYNTPSDTERRTDMRILVNGDYKYTMALIHDKPDYRNYLGWLPTPRSFLCYDTMKQSGLPIAADNSAYVNFDEELYWKMIHKLVDKDLETQWITVPDVVGNMEATLELWKRWRDRLNFIPRALVAQDGAEMMDLPWNDFECMFIGGTTEWKLSRSVVDIAGEALAKGKVLHMGRVNSERRLRFARRIGCNSVDGTGWSRWSKKYLKNGLEYLRSLDAQLMLEGVG